MKTSQLGIRSFYGPRLALAGLCMMFCLLELPTLGQLYTIDWSKIAGGGGVSTNNVYSISGTIGQADASVPEYSADGFYAITGGFWSLFSTAPTFYGTNLLLNPGAELGPGDLTGTNVVPVPFWTTSGNFTVAQYGASSHVTAAPPNAGTNYFAGGPSTALAVAQQTIDVSSLALDIDAGEDTCTVSGWLGGVLTDDDNAVFTANFEDAAGHVLGSVYIGPVEHDDRTNVTCFLFRQATQPVPSLTRKIFCTLVSTRVSGNYDDGYADNLSVVLNNTPPPATPPAVPLNANLLVNGDAESGIGSPGMATIVEPLPGWLTSGNLTASLWSAYNGQTGGSTGSNLFYGGHTGGNTFVAPYTNAANSVALQDVNVAARAADIDAGNLICNLSGLLGGYQGQDDNARFTANFLDAGGRTISNLTIGPVLAADRTNVSGVLPRSASAAVPAGTRTIRCVLLMTWENGGYNDAAADNLSVSLSSSVITRPDLSAITGGGGTSLTFSWPLAYGSWTLQGCTNLGSNPIQWTNVPRPYLTNGATISLTVSNTTNLPEQFFRLHQ
jgi:hypothetical protein